MRRNRKSCSFSVLTCVFNPEPDHLATCIASVCRQRVDWPAEVHHVLIDDGSTRDGVSEALEVAGESLATNVLRRSSNGGIVAASNDALRLARGEWIVLLDHDDELADGALARLAEHIVANPMDDIVYSDHDLIRPDGRFADPVYKPDFSPERLRQTNYITHLVAIRRRLVDDLGGFALGTDGAQDHDLLLRAMERGARFGHIPEILLHWRQSPRSVALTTSNKPEAFDVGRQVVAAHVERSGIAARVEAGAFPGLYRIDRDADVDTLVSIVVPTRGSVGEVWGRTRTFVVEAIRSIAARSTHRRLEFVVVTDTEFPDATFGELEAVGRSAGTPVVIVRVDAPFNFSDRVNTGAAHASGDLLLFLNDDTEMIEPNSVERMASLLMDGCKVGGTVGAVGARLLYPDGTLQHGGHVYHGEFMHACIGWGGDHPGPHRMLALERECAGVTAAALMTTRSVFDDAGGFPLDLPLHFNDVDFCLSVRELGHRILWTPFASWYHFEGRSRVRSATMKEWRRAASRWAGGTPHDPYYNPNFMPKRADWLERPGRSGAPPYVVDALGHRRWG